MTNNIMEQFNLLKKEIKDTIEALQADNAILRRTIDEMPSMTHYDMRKVADEALNRTPLEVLSGMRDEFTALGLNQMTPKMEEIIDMVNSAAGDVVNTGAPIDGDIKLTIPFSMWEALKSEEKARARGLYIGLDLEVEGD